MRSKNYIGLGPPGTSVPTGISLFVHSDYVRRLNTIFRYCASCGRRAIYPSDTIYEYDMFAVGERFWLLHNLKHLVSFARKFAKLNYRRMISDVVAFFFFIE